jgi:3-oxoacyl-[acyl-carrier-protein] synthase II
MAVYIKAASLISAQNTFREKILVETIAKPKNSCLKIIEPNYKEHILPVLLRRMNRLTKFSLTAAFDCMGQVGGIQPDAIITSSGLGCMDDTGIFLTQMHENEEKLLNPTAFIRSTHNTVGGQIALLKELRVPNFTHSQKEASFEKALFDGMLILDSGEAKNVLVGAFDEITDLSFDLLKQMGCLCETDVDKSTLLASKNSGVVVGEGAGFFMLSNQKDSSNCTKLIDLQVYRSISQDLNSLAIKFLSKFNMATTEIDLLVLGLNGTKNTRDLLGLATTGFKTSTVAGFKHLSGCFDTDSVFALWLAHSTIIKENISVDCCLLGENKRKFENVLIVNSSKAGSYSFILLAKC